MIHRATRPMLAIVLLAAAALTGAVAAQSEGMPVVLSLEDGSEQPFVIELYRGETPFVRFHDGERGSLGTVRVERGGEIVSVPIAEVARIDRIRFMDVRWFVTLRDGAVLEAPSASDGAFFEMAGVPSDGSRVRWTIYVARDEQAPFVGVIFAPELGYPAPRGEADAR